MMLFKCVLLCTPNAVIGLTDRCSLLKIPGRPIDRNIAFVLSAFFFNVYRGVLTLWQVFRSGGKDFEV